VRGSEKANENHWKLTMKKGWGKKREEAVKGNRNAGIALKKKNKGLEKKEKEKKDVEDRRGGGDETPNLGGLQFPKKKKKKLGSNSSCEHGDVSQNQTEEKRVLWNRWRGLKGLKEGGATVIARN